MKGSKAQQGKKIEVKGQIERESAEEEKRVVGLVGGLYEGLIIQRVLFTPWWRRNTSYANDRRNS